MKKFKRVVVTGIGVVSDNGIGKEVFYKNCAAGKTGIKKCSLYSTENLMTDSFGEISEDLPDSKVIPTGETRLKAIMRKAVNEMMDDSGFCKKDIESFGADAWLCLGTLLANTDGALEYAEGLKSGVKLEGYLENFNDYAVWLRELCGIHGGSWINSAACAAGTTAAGMAFDFIKNGFCKICIVGGADPLTKSAAYGFHSLKSLSTGICNPYDENRDGINIGEGAAFFVFEEMDAAVERGANIYGEIVGYGLTNDAYHATSPDPDGKGILEAMSEAVRDAGIDFSQVGHINGHGTGTPINDHMEINAINKLFPTASVTSTKALIGHCMGASGALELAAELLAFKHNEYLPLPNLKNPVETANENTFSNKLEKNYSEYKLSNSLAFAGNTACLAIKNNI